LERSGRRRLPALPGGAAGVETAGGGARSVSARGMLAGRLGFRLLLWAATRGMGLLGRTIGWSWPVPVGFRGSARSQNRVLLPRYFLSWKRFFSQKMKKNIFLESFAYLIFFMSGSTSRSCASNFLRRKLLFCHETSGVRQNTHGLTCRR
jgi:hypothetical protein